MVEKEDRVLGWAFLGLTITRHGECVSVCRKSIDRKKMQVVVGGGGGKGSQILLPDSERLVDSSSVS